ncbi:CenpB-DNA-bind-domain-containing protein [Suillus decipiens]|nr:CenpB-DNA-bind-domain-containing protein [Suillus decipiens]
MNVPEDEDMRVAKHRPSKFPEVEEALVEWLLQMKQQQQNTLLSDNLIRTKAKETARSLQIPDERFKASSGWVENFKHRHNIRKGVWQGHEKVLRASRGHAGIQEHRRGATDTVLSPLNPAFEGRSEVTNGRDSEEHSTMADGDDDMESEDEPEVPHPLQSQNDTGSSMSQASLGPTLPLPRMWALQTDHLTAPSTPLSSVPPGNAHEPISHQSFVHQRHEERQPDPVAADINLSALPNPVQQHLQVTDPQQGVQLTHPDPGSQYTEPAVVYQPAPPITAGDTNIGEAEDAINKVIVFVDSRPNLLSQTQRDVLHEIKCTLFQLGSGVPFDRNWR